MDIIEKYEALKASDKMDNFFQMKLPEIGDNFKNRINNDFQILNPAF